MRVKRRATLTTLAAAALVLTVFAGAAATAASPYCDKESPKYDLSHPSCDDITTTTTAAPELAACTTDMTVIGKSSTSLDCLWTPVDDGSTVATVTVSNIAGAIKKAPVVFVLDDFPGDICVLEQSWVGQPGQDYDVSFDLFYDEVPVGYDVEYNAWLGTSYWNFEYDDGDITTDSIFGAHWCAPQDPHVDHLRLDTNGTPLHVRVVFNAGKGGSLDITLSPEQG